MGCRPTTREVPFETLLSLPLRNGLTKPKAQRGSGVKMISMGELFSSNRIGCMPMDRVPVTDKELELSCIAPSDLLFARQSLVLEGAGKCSFVKEVSEPTVFESHLIRARIDRAKAEPEYLYYFFKSPQGRERIASIVEQVAAAGIRGRDLARLSIPCPELDFQRRVVTLFSCIDNKIDANAKLNGYLADLGDALFAQALKENKQEIAYQTVESFCEVKGGKRLPKGSELISDANSHPYIRVRDLNNTTVLQLTPEMLYVDDETQANISRYIVNDGDVIVSVVGTIGLTAYIGNTLNGANLTENCNKLTSFNGDLAAWSHFFLRSPDGAEAIRLGTVGAVQAKLPLKNIKSIEVPFIPALEMEKTVAKLNDILSAIQINLVESLALGELRTTLLPRLISGEIDVSKIDITQLNSHLS